MITDAVRRYIAAGIALAAIALAAWSGSAIRGWIDAKEIKRIDDERIAAVEAEAKIIAATEYAKSESEILAAKWRDGANESQAKSSQLLAAVAVDRDRLAVRVRELESRLSKGDGSASAAGVPASAGGSVDSGPAGVDGQGDGQDLGSYAETCERYRVGLIAAQDYLRVIGAVK